MSPRKYSMDRRQSAVYETRERILATARELFSESGFHTTSLDLLARRSDVARATVYHHFQNKLGLLNALIDDTQNRAGMERLSRLRDDPDALRTLRQAFGEVCRFWAAEHLLIRNIIGMAAVDPDARQVVARRDRTWRVGIEQFVAILAERGFLNPVQSAREAAAALGLLFSFQAFDQLYSGWNLSAPEAANLLRHLASAYFPVLAGPMDPPTDAEVR